MKIVQVISPFRAKTVIQRMRHSDYAKAAMLDCFERGEAPFVSHLLYPQVLDDKDHEEREWGMRAGQEIARLCATSVVYIDLGISGGMKDDMAKARKQRRSIERRSLPKWG